MAELTMDQIEEVADKSNQLLNLMFEFVIELKTTYRGIADRELLEAYITTYESITDEHDPEYSVRASLAVARGLIPLVDSLSQFEAMLEAKGML